MSGEIKILFYVIAGIVYFISTFYNKEKKKQNQKEINRKLTDTETAKEIFEEIKRTILQPQLIKEEKKPLEKKVFKKQEREPEIKINYKSFKEKKKKPIEDTMVAEPHFEHHKEPEIKDFVESTDALEFNFDESDPRKAFIFSEIFRRPQY